MKDGNGSMRISRRGLLSTATAFGALQAMPALAKASDIPLGMILPFSGATGAYGPDMKKAADIIVGRINGTGGILGGRKLALYVEDSESNPTVGVTAAQKLLQINHVGMIGGFWGSPIALACKPLLLAANKVQMVSAAADAITEGDTKGLVWRFQAKSSQWGPAGAKVFHQLGVKKVAVLALQNPFIIAMLEPFKQEMAKYGGVVTDVVLYNPGQPSYRAEVEKVFAPAPEAVFCLSLLPDFVLIAKEVYQGGFKSKILSLSIAADAHGKFLKAVGPEVADGIYHIQPSPPLKAPSYKKFVKRMGAPEGTVFLFAGNAHDQICVAALAMEKAKSTDPLVWSKKILTVCDPPGERVDDVIEALQMIRAGKKIKFVGAGASCDFNAHGDQVNRSFLLQVIKNGQNKIVGVIA